MSALSQPFLHAYETPSCLPIHFAVTLSMYALIPAVYRALLKSAVSGTCHRIHITKDTTYSPGDLECMQYSTNMRPKVTIVCKHEHMNTCSLCSWSSHAAAGMMLCSPAPELDLELPQTHRLCNAQCRKLRTERKSAYLCNPMSLHMHFNASRSLRQTFAWLRAIQHKIPTMYDPSTLPSSANQCMLGNVYLRSNSSRNPMSLVNVA